MTVVGRPEGHDHVMPLPGQRPMAGMSRVATAGAAPSSPTPPGTGPTSHQERGRGAPQLQRVLFVHNGYRVRGGEDSVVDSEIELLRQRGHEVIEYRRHNDEIGAGSKLSLLRDTIWSPRSHADVRRLIREQQVDVVHVHNTLPLVSPAVYWAAAAESVPVVQTLHNFRLMCPQALFLREERVCEDCVGHVPWRAVRHRCYRDSTVQSAVVAGMLTTHRMLGTYRDKVTRYIALNEFCRTKFIEGGLPADRIVLKPNFVDLPPQDVAERRQGGLFVGRLSKEKGLSVLSEAAKRLPQPNITVIGGGELEPEARAAFGERMVGFKPLPEILALMSAASYLVIPSIWYENFPRTIVEAYACGLPVIASRLGALPEIVVEGHSGLLFDPGSPQDLADKLAWAEAHPHEMRQMGHNARALYERLYTPQRNYERLIEIYAEARQAVPGRAAQAA
ncbi:glycosyltransferase family 4 protein [Caldimonas brevitalea]|uniref:Glycosyltransferase n=1 Tax=Caldimonas brevitalea TaxID=413882 RepID=A0A0G3BN00_9BURK|nr:glycosyltransferase family 4 protein [Caldimonas brevitalea]AKJ27925.1 glycosyltransferase [Caldimonas brevitalea]